MTEVDCEEFCPCGSGATYGDCCQPSGIPWVKVAVPGDEYPLFICLGPNLVPPVHGKDLATIERQYASIVSNVPEPSDSGWRKRKQKRRHARHRRPTAIAQAMDPSLNAKASPQNTSRFGSAVKPIEVQAFKSVGLTTDAAIRNASGKDLMRWRATVAGFERMALNKSRSEQRRRMKSAQGSGKHSVK